MPFSHRSRSRARGVVALGLLAAMAGGSIAEPATAQDQARPPSSARGELVAERLCSYCHQIRPGRSPDVEAQAPSFLAIANTPGRDAEFLRLVTNELHLVRTIGNPPVVMPTAILTPEAREDVIAYLLTFKR